MKHQPVYYKYIILLSDNEVAYRGNLKRCRMVKREYIANGFSYVRIFKEIA